MERTTKNFEWQLLALLGLLVASCKDGSAESPGPCPRDSSAFRLQLTAADGALPSDVELSVTFGGASKEVYSLLGDHSGNETVCCQSGPELSGPLKTVPCDPTVAEPTLDSALRALGRDSGATDSEPAEAIQCELWTNGAARVEVIASGYQLLDDTLTAQVSEEQELEDCPAIETKQVSLVLERGDAGTVQP